MAQKFAAYNPATGAITGFYDEVDSPVPMGAEVIEITDDEWQAALLTPGYTVKRGQLEAPPAPTASEQLSAARQLQVGILRQSCLAAITGGFTSSALGSPCTYPSTPTDIQNLNDATTAALSGTASSLWCEDANGNWAFTPHTAAEIIQVHKDWVAFRVSKQQELVGLVQQVRAAPDVSAVQEITWQ
jgi:hypothetical protein